ncbi:MAG: hypothetical protein LBQ14_01855 [Treponema sp.]|jgi:hypothetical protein|nr:hypothetical protein [Treponema sp.]
MKAITQQYIGSTEEWENQNPVLFEAVWGIEELADGRRLLKIGNGKDRWNDLEYVDKRYIKGLAEEIAHIDFDRVPGNDTPEMDGEGFAGDPDNWNYSRSDHRHPSDTTRVALESGITQIVDSDIALANGKKLLGVKKDHAQANLVSVGDYGAYEQIEVGTKSDPLCLNHNARALDGTVVGKNIIVNYKDEAGENKADAVAYESEVQALERDMDAWIGRGGFLDEYDFGTATPTQEALTDYALSQIPSISEPADIWNGTKIKNIYDGHTWVLTNTQDTDPAVFDWTDQGTIDLSGFTNTTGGYIKGEEEKPGYVNAQENHTGKVNGWDNLPEQIFNLFKPVGSSYVQRLNDPTPKEMGWLGDWEIWSGRADAYRLSDDPLPAFTAYTQGANYAAGDCVLWHIEGDDWRLYTAKEAITGAPEYLDPVKWDKLQQGDIVERRLIQAWTDGDLAVGDEIASGAYAGGYVTEVIVPGGKFTGIEGGFRPTFVSGGVQGDRIRNIIGTAEVYPWSSGVSFIMFSSGAFMASRGDSRRLSAVTGADTSGNRASILDMSIDRVVPTGPDNAPANLSAQLWRRVG